MSQSPCPLGGEAAAEKAVKAAYGVAFARGGAIGCGERRAVGALGLDQAFVIFTIRSRMPKRVVAGKLKGKAYTTDQTDVWVALESAGAVP